MALNISDGLALKHALDNETQLESGFLILFSGVVPADVDDAIDGSSTSLATITKDGDGATGLTFETPTTGTLTKTTAEVWKCLGANVASGTATFYRWCMGSDDGTAASATNALRVQGTIGTDPNTYDLVLSSTTLTNGTDVNIDAFSFYSPTS